MGKIADILEEKGGTVYRIGPTDSVFEAVKTMVEHNVGALLVTAGDEIHGIVTERDYLRRVSVEGRTAKATAVEEIMSSPVVFVGSDTDIEECMAVMTDRRIRHAPVIDDGKLVGIVSIGDLVKYLSREQKFTIQYLTDYMQAR